MITTLFKIAIVLNLFGAAAAQLENEGYKPFDEEIRCSDGSIGIVEHIQEHSMEPFQPAIYKVDCSSKRSQNSTTSDSKTAKKNGDAVFSGLEKRQSTNVCSSSCSNSCYGGTGIPLKSDCDKVANNLASRGQTHTVNSLEKLVASSGTCLFRFTNQGYGSVTWCDSQWATQSRTMESQCLPQTPGAYCQGTNFLLDVCLNPDAPTTTSSTAQVYQTPTQATTSSSNNRAAEGTTTTSSTPASQSTSSGTSTGSASSVSGSQSSTASQTLSGVAYIPSISADFAGESSAAIAQSFDTTAGATTKQGPNAGAIAGGVIGALALLALLIFALLFWRKRSKIQGQHVEAIGANEQNHAAPEMGYSGQTVAADTSTESETAPAPGRVLPPGPWYAKATRQQQQQQQHRPFVLQGGESAASSAQQLLSQTDDSSAVPDTPLTSTSIVPPSTQMMAAQQTAPMYELGRRSISARTLAQQVAPDLSERDIRRLADTIVARMQAGAPVVPQDEPSSGTVSSSVIADPPPPWRASWNSDTTDPRSRVV